MTYYMILIQHYLLKNKSKTSKFCPWNFSFLQNPGRFHSKSCLNEANLSPMPIQAMFCFCMNIYKNFLFLHYILHFFFFIIFFTLESFVRDAGLVAFNVCQGFLVFSSEFVSSFINSLDTGIDGQILYLVGGSQFMCKGSWINSSATRFGRIFPRFVPGKKAKN